MDGTLSGGSAVIGALAGFLGSLLLGATGIAVGGAARYGVPPAHRRTGGWLLAGLGAAVMVGIAVMAGVEGPRSGYAWFAIIVASWFPGFAAASLGANRWILLGMVPAGILLASFVMMALASASDPFGTTI